MFNIGFSEMVVLVIIGLIVIGPEQLPDLARRLIRLVNDIKRMKEEVMQPLDDLKDEAVDILHKVREEGQKVEIQAHQALEAATKPHQSLPSVKKEDDSNG